MEPESSLTCLEDSATGPYPEPNPIHSLTSNSLTFILVLFSYLYQGFPNSSFP
jgi:hypothetical protein